MNNLSLTACSIWIREKNPGKNNTVNIVNLNKKIKGEYTILIVAHRLSTVIDSDRIFVVSDGKIIDNGSHKELLKRCDIYKNLYNKDLSKIN